MRLRSRVTAHETGRAGAENMGSTMRLPVHDDTAQQLSGLKDQCRMSDAVSPNRHGNDLYTPNQCREIGSAGVAIREPASEKSSRISYCAQGTKHSYGAAAICTGLGALHSSTVDLSARFAAKSMADVKSEFVCRGMCAENSRKANVGAQCARRADAADRLGDEIIS